MYEHNFLWQSRESNLRNATFHNYWFDWAQLRHVEFHSSIALTLCWVFWLNLFLAHVFLTILTLELNGLTIAVGQQNLITIGCWQTLELLRMTHDISVTKGSQLGLQLSLPLHGLSVLLEIQLEGLNVIVEAKRRHGKQNILSINCFSFFCLTTLTGFTENRKIRVFQTTWILCWKVDYGFTL